MLTLGKYRAQTGIVKPFDKKVLDLGQVGKDLAAKLCNRYSLNLENSSEFTLNAMAKQALESKELPPKTQILTKSDFSYWTIRDGVAQKKSSVSCRIHRLVNPNEIKSRIISKKKFDQHEAVKKTRLSISSSNFPHIPDSECYSGSMLINLFKGSIQALAPRRTTKDLMSMRWGYENIHLYEEKEVNFVLKKLVANGFFVEIQAPYIIVIKNRPSGKLDIRPRQPISVHIPEGASIESDAVYQKNHSYKSSLSVHNALVKCRDTSEKISLKKENIADKITVDQVLEQISTELTFVASRDSLIKRYAFNVNMLDPVKQLELSSQLIALGYTVTLDVPFVSQKFTDMLDGFKSCISKQYIFIDLP